jgi:hypothetical protein
VVDLELKDQLDLKVRLDLKVYQVLKEILVHLVKVP